MKAIFEQTGHERERLTEVLNNIRVKTEGMKMSDMFDNYKTQTTRGRKMATGIISDALIEQLGRIPTEEEVIMLIDRGFYHFGASCTFSERSFSCMIYTD